MARYRIVTKRALYNGVIIEAEDMDAARRFDGDVIDEAETDTWGDDTISCDEVDDDCEEVGDLP